MSGTDDLNRQIRDALTADGWQSQEAPAKPRISRGRDVITLGPWSNGHEEQCAKVTHVYGDGLPGDVVNLFVFVDCGQPQLVDRVPWYPTRAEAVQALNASPEMANITGSAVCCYFPDRV